MSIRKFTMVKRKSNNERQNNKMRKQRKKSKIEKMKGKKYDT